MKQAVIATGSKQYLVAPGQTLKIDKRPWKEGEPLVFAEVLCVVDGDKTVVGKPYVKDAKVVAEVVTEQKGKKVLVEKFHSKKRYHVKKGHREIELVIKVKEIS